MQCTSLLVYNVESTYWFNAEVVGLMLNQLYVNLICPLGYIWLANAARLCAVLYYLTAREAGEIREECYDRNKEVCCILK